MVEDSNPNDRSVAPVQSSPISRYEPQTIHVHTTPIAVEEQEVPRRLRVVLGVALATSERLMEHYIGVPVPLTVAIWGSSVAALFWGVWPDGARTLRARFLIGWSIIISIWIGIELGKMVAENASAEASTAREAMASQPESIALDADIEQMLVERLREIIRREGPLRAEVGYGAGPASRMKVATTLHDLLNQAGFEMDKESPSGGSPMGTPWFPISFSCTKEKYELCAKIVNDLSAFVRHSFYYREIEPQHMGGVDIKVSVHLDPMFFADGSITFLE